MQDSYKHLDAAKIVDTVVRLRQRITERFPSASLGRLVGELEVSARESIVRLAWIRRPLLSLRLLTAVVVVGVPLGLYLLEEELVGSLAVVTIAEFMQTVEAALGILVFSGAGILFVATLEIRIKRARALRVVHELRSLAHIVDMHQLTKDPERITGAGDTPSSPVRQLTPFELERYYDYCSETLSLVSKVAAAYAQGFSDPVVLDAVDAVEGLCTGLSRKIWQKIIVLGQVAGRGAGPAGT